MMLDLQPIEYRLAAATPGPWGVSFNPIPPGGKPVAQVNTIVILSDEPLYGSPIEDAELIANAPTDLAALVAEVERLRKEVQQCKIAIAEHQAELCMEPRQNEANRRLWETLDA